MRELIISILTPGSSAYSTILYRLYCEAKKIFLFRDILEWNGYEIVDDVLIYSRLAIDNVSEVQEEWQDIDNLSDVNSHFEFAF